MVSKAVENAQRQIEELNYERRKNVLKYDDVMNAQREVIYGERQKILQGEDLKGQALEFVDEVVRGIVDEYLPADVFPEEWELDGLVTGVNEVYP
jgi:preprotein translocase subunit SecA